MYRSKNLGLHRLVIVLVTLLFVGLGGAGLEAQTKKQTPKKQAKKVEQTDPSSVVPEDPPAFPGGMEGLMSYIKKELVYPKEAKEKGLSGRVFIAFVIDTDGSVVEAKVSKGVDPILDSEALRVVENMPKWTPGRSQGKIIRVPFVLPIVFMPTK